MNDRSGFTLVEILVAMVILGFVIVSTQAMITSRFVSDVSMQDHRAAAVQLAMDRLQLIQQDPNYATFESRYGGTESNLPAYPGYVRTTQIVRTNSSSTGDFKRVTVRVSGPGLKQPVARTITVGAP